MRASTCLLIVATVLSLPWTIKAQNTPPIAPVREVIDSYFGVKVVDPYRYMENLNDAEVQAWIKAQNDYTRKILDNLPSRKELLERIRVLNNAGTVVTDLQVIGEQYFYLKTSPGDNNRKLYVRDGLSGPEKALVDPDQITIDGRHPTLDFYRASYDGRYIAYGISLSGSEDDVIHVVEVATLRELNEKIDRVTVPIIEWHPDNRSFFYNRLAGLSANSSANERYDKSLACRHVLGTNPEKDKPVLGYKLSDNLNISEIAFPLVFSSPVSNYALGVINQGVQSECEIYIAPITSVIDSSAPWRKVVDVTDQVTDFALRDDDLYLLTHRNAARFKIIHVKVSAPNLSHPEIVVPPSEAVVTGLRIGKDALYVELRNAGIGSLVRVPFSKDGPRQHLRLPFAGAIRELVTSPLKEGALFRLESWNRAPALYAFDPLKEETIDTKLIPPSTADASQIEFYQTKVKGTDGTLIPLSIIHKTGVLRNGANPTILRVYGAYGLPVNPRFDPVLLAWLERGGIYAVAHVRGGGEYGEEWHEAGMMLKKPNSTADYIACAQFLIQEKYTSSTHLGGEGISAGGVPLSNAIVERPDLLKAAILTVSDPNMLRHEQEKSGPVNVPEFGTVKTQEGFKALFAVDAYHKIKNGVAYPAVLLMTGLEDTRVDSWQSAKMTARLQTATRSSKPILLRADFGSGHGVVTTKSQTEEMAADKFAFLFSQLGEPGSQRTQNVRRQGNNRTNLCQTKREH